MRMKAQWRLVLLALPLLLYCALPTRNYYWDGIAFAIDIEKHPLSASLLYPSHLIYESFGGLLYWFSRIAGIETRALFLMQGANCIVAGLCVFLLDKCLRLRNVQPEISVAWALVFGFSATWWRFASDANAYVPAIFLLLCADLILARRGTGAAVAAGLCTAAAMLFHELAVLFLLAALVRSWVGQHRAAVGFAAASIIPVALAYSVAYRSTPGGSTAGGFLAWLTWHSPDSSFSFHPLTDLALSLRGSLRLFFGGRIAEFAGDGISKAALVPLPVAVVWFLLSVAKAIRAGVRLVLPARHLLVWTGLYIAFLFFWMPQNTFYRLCYLAPLILLLATTLPEARRAVWLFAAILALWNFAFLAYPQSRKELNAPLRFALAQRTQWKPGTMILFRTFHPDLWTISYFNQQASWIGIARPTVQQLDQRILEAQAGGNPLWLEETAYEAIVADPAGRAWIELHERRGELAEFKDDRHDFRFHCIR
jgi:hypothetical protein